MKIAYILNPTMCDPKNGVRIQAEAWRQALIELGHDVEIPSMYDIANFSEYDIIHFFGTGLALLPYIDAIHSYNPNIAVSPIIDSYKPTWLYKLAVNTSFPSLRIHSVNGALKDVRNKVKKVFVRSLHEYDYISKAYGYPNNKIALVRLAHRMSSDINIQEYFEKENYCFHVSAIYQSRKNVLRLIKAAKKYGFQLVLAGSCGNENQFRPLKEEIGDATNIKVLGRISEEELIENYEKAKVFALPSIEEGVGQVALEAACYGCNIVITKLGGPKEYFEDKAWIVNPFNVDDIGQKIMQGLSAPVNPDLAHHVSETYSRNNVAQQLIKEYRSMLS